MDISSVIKEQLKTVLAESFDAFKSGLENAWAEIAMNASATLSEIESIKHCIKDMEGGISKWLDETSACRATVDTLKNQVEQLGKKRR